eukprot:355299-Chlamydomonas_euryale.AAC.5
MVQEYMYSCCRRQFGKQGKLQRGRRSTVLVQREKKSLCCWRAHPWEGGRCAPFSHGRATGKGTGRHGVLTCYVHARGKSGEGGSQHIQVINQEEVHVMDVTACWQNHSLHVQGCMPAWWLGLLDEGVAALCDSMQIQTMACVSMCLYAG